MENKKYKEIELRCEEVQEVMNHIPSWILRWGITVLFQHCNLAILIELIDSLLVDSIIPVWQSIPDESLLR